MPNYKKATWDAILTSDLDGRSGVFNYAGHFTPYGVGLHVKLTREPDRPVVVLLNDNDVEAVRQLLAAYDAQKETV